MKHGSILGGLATTPDLDAALADYRDTLDLELRETGKLPGELADAWGAPASAGQPMAMLQPKSGAPCFIRLVEQPDHPDFTPTTSFGWASYELSVKDVFGWPARLRGSGFDIVGPPKELEGLPYFVPMQITGRGREMLYLNEVREDTPSSDLPRAASLTDRIFIVILASPDRAATVAWYRDKLGLDEGDTYTLEYTMINDAFGLPAGTRSDLTMVQNGRLPIFEVDDYPAEATARPRHADMLPPGNALVTLAADDLDALELDWIQAPQPRGGPLYRDRRAATVIGSAGERLELVETDR